MAEKDEKTDKEMEEKIARQKEIKDPVQAHARNIKNIAESLTALIGKEIFTEEDIDAAFELADGIEEQHQEIIALLFDLRTSL